MENEKINVAELLKDCPSGMELNCLLWDNVIFDRVADGGIWIKHINSESDERLLYVYNDGSFPIHNLSPFRTKCVIFPKGKTTWEGFQKPFKDGDIVFYDNCVSIFKEWGIGTLFRNYVKVDIDGRHPMLCDRTDSNGKGIKREARFATEEEKEKLFKAIEDKGYRWNPETKTLKRLVEPKFKVGDKVKHKCDKNNIVITITCLKQDCYYIQYFNNIKNEYQNEAISFTDQDKYELIIDKFDIKSLKPFDKVLVRDGNDDVWVNAFFGFCDSVTYKTCIFVTGNENWCQCIPYEGNEHLLGTTDDCENYFKTWQKS